VCSFNRSKAAMILLYASYNSFHPIPRMKSPYFSKSVGENPITEIIIWGTDVSGVLILLRTMGYLTLFLLAFRQSHQLD